MLRSLHRRRPHTGNKQVPNHVVSYQMMNPSLQLPLLLLIREDPAVPLALWLTSPGCRCAVWCASLRAPIGQSNQEEQQWTALKGLFSILTI